MRTFQILLLGFFVSGQVHAKRLNAHVVGFQKGIELLFGAILPKDKVHENLVHIPMQKKLQEDRGVLSAYFETIGALTTGSTYILDLQPKIDAENEYWCSEAGLSLQRVSKSKDEMIQIRMNCIANMNMITMRKNRLILVCDVYHYDFYRNCEFLNSSGKTASIDDLEKFGFERGFVDRYPQIFNGDIEDFSIRLPKSLGDQVLRNLLDNAYLKMLERQNK